MGIKGAAIATLISQLFNLVFIAVGFALCIRKDGDKPVWSLRFSKITVRDYLIMIMPILVSEFLWSLPSTGILARQTLPHTHLHARYRGLS